MRATINDRVARSLRRWVLALAAGAYLAAAAMPCPPSAGAAASTRADVARRVTALAAHPGHGDHAAATGSSRAGDSAVIAAPCYCGCGKRAGGVSASRLGPVLPLEAVVVAPARARVVAMVCPRDARSLALAPPDPVPISRFA